MLKVESVGMFTCSDSQIAFSFQGDEKTLNQIENELILEGLSLNESNCNKKCLYDKRFQYVIQIQHDNFNDLVKIFKYKHERLGFKEDSDFKIFRSIKTEITYQKESEIITGTLQDVLIDAARTANKLVEGSSKKTSSQKSSYSKTLCKLGIFTAAAAICYTVGSELFKEYSP